MKIHNSINTAIEDETKAIAFVIANIKNDVLSNYFFLLSKYNKI